MPRDTTLTCSSIHYSSKKDLQAWPHDGQKDVTHLLLRQNIFISCLARKLKANTNWQKTRALPHYFRTWKGDMNRLAKYKASAMVAWQIWSSGSFVGILCLLRILLACKKCKWKHRINHHNTCWSRWLVHRWVLSSGSIYLLESLLHRILRPTPPLNPSLVPKPKTSQN